MVGDKKPDEVIQKCKYKCLYQRHYMILCSYSTQIPVLIITSNRSFLELLDPKGKGRKLLQNLNTASHHKDSNPHQHYQQNPKFHNAMCCFTQLPELRCLCLTTTVHTMRILDKA